MRPSADTVNETGAFRLSACVRCRNGHQEPECQLESSNHNWRTSKPNRKILVSESLRGYSSSGRLNSSGTPPWGVTRGPPGPVPRVPPKCRDCAESCNFMQGGSWGVGVPWVLAFHTLLYYTPPFRDSSSIILNSGLSFLFQLIYHLRLDFQMESHHEMLLGD